MEKRWSRHNKMARMNVYSPLATRHSPLESGQSVIEYAMWLAVVIAALTVMQVYLKRAICGEYSSTAGSLGPQYAPQHTNSTTKTLESGASTTTSSLVRQKEIVVDGKAVKADVMDTTSTIDAANPQTSATQGSYTVDAPTGNNLWNN